MGYGLTWPRRTVPPVPPSPPPGPLQGISEIKHMEEFPDLRSLFLECNCLETMEGLSENRELRCLFFQQNMLEEIDHLEELQELTTLNVSHNQISKLENLSCLPKLETLQASHNKLATARSISHLLECPSLTVVDLAHNELEEEEVLQVLQGMPNLACLYLQGNPVVTKKRYYRKTMIARIPTLKYLDDRPVFPLERQCAEAWSREGLEGERAARAQFKEEEAERDRANYEYMKKIREEGWAKRRAAAGLPPTEGDPFFDDLGDGEWEVPQEPPELVAARERLAVFAAQAGEEEPPELTARRTALAAEGVAIRQSRAPPREEGFISELHTSAPIEPEEEPAAAAAGGEDAGEVTLEAGAGAGSAPPPLDPQSGASAEAEASAPHAISDARRILIIEEDNEDDEDEDLEDLD